MVRELLLASALFLNPVEANVDEPIVLEPSNFVQLEEQEAVSNDKVQVQDENGNVYWIDFNKVDWKSIDIDWSNLDTDQFVDIMVSVAAQAMSPELLALLGAVGSIAIVCIGLLIKAYKEKLRANMTSTECADKVIERVETVLNNTITQLIKEKVEDKVSELTAASKIQTDSTLKLLRVSALMQENTPDAKRAIIDELVDSGRLEEKLAQEAKNEVDKQEEEEKQHKEDILEKIESMKTNEDGTTI